MQQLRIHGARRVFLVPGESYLPCIDALHEHAGAIEPVVCRQESGAAYMAEAYGKLTGEPGICFVTRGPGATNASIGVHTAFQDSTPMILFVGQVGNDFMEREAFQEIDYRRMFGPMAKWVAQIDRCDRIPEFIARAYATATSGRPGPVVLALPEDTLGHGRRPGHAALPARAEPSRRAGPRTPARRAGRRAPSLPAAGRQRLDRQGGRAHRRLRPGLRAAGRRLAAAGMLRPAPSQRRRPGRLGMTDALRAPRAADLILAVGTRLGEATTEGYLLPACPRGAAADPRHPDPEELGRVYQPWQAVVAGPTEFAEAAATLIPGHAASRAQAVRQAHQEYLDSLEPLPAPGPLSLDALAAGVNQRLPADACVTVGAGNYALYPHRYRQFAGPGTSLAPTLGATPAALSAKLEHPQRTVVCYAGDGCFQMNMQELGVAQQYRLGVVVLVFNNGMWGTIRAHQEREFPGRPIALGFENPDFAQIARGYRGYGEIVTRTEDFAAAFERALAYAERERLPALLDIRYDADGIAPGQTLSAIRDAALARQAAPSTPEP